jgi:hypothetical protein
MSEFSPPERHPLLIEAEQLIADQSDPFVKASMMTTAIGEGMPLTLDELMDTIAAISDEDERSPYVITPYQHKTYITQRAVGAFVAQERFAETWPLLESLRARDSFLYMESVVSLLQKGYAGPNDELLRFTTIGIRDLVIHNPAQKKPQDPLAVIKRQSHYMELYLKGVAHTGADIAAIGSEYSNMLSIIRQIDTAKSENPWQNQLGMHMPRVVTCIPHWRGKRWSVTTSCVLGYA